MDILVAIVLVLASFAGTGLLIFALRSGQKRRARLQEMSEANGWTFSYEPQSGGRGSRTVISDPQEGWEVVLYYRSNSSTGGSSSHWSQFEQPRLALPEGMALLGPEIPEKTKAMADSVLGSMGGGGIMRMILDKMTGGLGDEAADLRAVPGAGSGSLFATPGCETALDGLREAPELADARRGRNDAQHPIVSRNRHGLRIRYSHMLRKSEQVADFIALGRALSARLES